MKKILIFVLLSALLLCLVACGGSAEQEEVGPPLPPYLGTWEFSLLMDDGSIATHTLTLGEDGFITYNVVGTYSGSPVYEEEYSFYDWTEEDFEISCNGSEYGLVLLYDEEADTLTDVSNADNVFKRTK